MTLNLTASDGTGSGVASVLISNSTDFSGATPVPYAASLPWTLTAGDGTKTVYVKFIDDLGNTSVAPVSDTIILDTAGPAAGSVSIESGAAVIGTRDVTVSLSGVAGDATGAQASNSADMSGALAVTQPARSNGPWLRAPMGRVRSMSSGVTRRATGPRPPRTSIVLDTVAPTGTVVINAGKAWTKSTAVSLTFPNTAGDTVQVRVGTASTIWSGGRTRPTRPG